MFFDLQKIKTEQNTTSTSIANAISRKREEVFFFFFFFSEDSDSDSSSFALDSEKSKTFDKPIFELLEVKIFVGKPNPMSLTKIGIQNLPLLICNLKKDF